MKNWIDFFSKSAIILIRGCSRTTEQISLATEIPIFYYRDFLFSEERTMPNRIVLFIKQLSPILWDRVSPSKIN